MQINQLKFGIYLSYASLFISNITNLILTPFIIRNLGQSEYGLYMLIGAFVGYIAVLDFGLGNATIRFVAKYRAENDKRGEENFLFSTFILYSIISLIILIIGTVIYINLDNIFSDSLTLKEIEIAKVMFIILVISLALTLPMNLFTGIISAYERFVFPRLLTISRILVRAIILFVLLSLGYKAIAIIIVDAILNLLMMIINMSYVILKLNVKIRLHRIDKTIFKEIFSYSALIFISVVVDQIYWKIGHLVLGVIASTSEVAIFAIGMVFGQYFIVFSTAISGVFLPKITKMVVNKATGEELTNLLIKTGRLQFLMLGFVLGGFVLFGERFILLWAGPGYKNSWFIALLVMIPLLLVLTQTIGISILQAKNMHGFRAIVYLCISIINIFISIYLSKLYGSVGAAIGTTLSLIFGNIIAMNLYYHFKVHLNIPRFYKELFKGLLISLLGSVAIGSMLLLASSISWVSLILQCIIYSILYSIFMWYFGMNNYEKKLFLGEFNKIKARVF
ncbi:oligosaccharide flippase family protein [Peribacillus butanolivorans]|uniref:oligosaccharide flippase family protein n=1 Tax=Peribacillus butanolivorans TaxID=421767 RepID=UPI0039FDD9CC